MGKLKQILKEARPSFILVGGLATLISGVIYFSGIGKIEQEEIPRIYQGYHISGKDDTTIVFDDKPYYLRKYNEKPNLRISGNPKELGIKKLGTKYILTIGETRWSILLDKLGFKKSSWDRKNDVILKAKRVENSD